jgi:hypothetical protein
MFTRFSIAAGVFHLFAFATLGQNARVQVTVRGSVKTPQGAALPFAALDIGGNRLTADKEGRFESSALSAPSGTLYLIAEHPGFEPTVRVSQVQANDIVQIDIVLVPRSDCPAGLYADPPPHPLFSSDFVEIEIPAQLLAGYRVRIRADGEVLWRGAFEERTTIPAQNATALIEKFRTPEFWSLCGNYHSVGKIVVADGPVTFTTVQIGNQIRRVADWNRSAPEVLRSLQRDFWALANMPRTPGLFGISPGIRFGPDRNAMDSRGWTPLMYATQMKLGAGSHQGNLQNGGQSQLTVRNR